MNGTSTPTSKHSGIKKKESASLYELERDIQVAEQRMKRELDKLIIKVPKHMVEKLLERIRVSYQQHMN